MSSRGKNAVPEVDISLLRPPIELSGSGVSQILQTMQVGTPEMQEVLLHQCDIIFECKVCRNLFRGLANLIAHKRVYCKAVFVDTRLNFVETKPEPATAVVFPKNPPKQAEKAEWDDYIESDEELPKSEIKQNGSTVIEQMNKGKFVGKSEEYKFYTKAVERQAQKEDTRKSSTIVLNSVPDNPNVVFQSVAKEDGVVEPPELPRGRGRPRRKRKIEEVEEDDKKSDCSSIRSKDEEIVVVEPKPATSHHVRMNLRQRNAGNMAEKLKERDDCDTKTLECLKCNIIYSSIKSLHNHMTSIHSEKRTFFPCVKCSAVFSQVWGVTRHMSTAHSLSKEQTKALMDEIRAGSFEKTIDDTGEMPTIKNGKEGKAKEMQNGNKSKEKEVDVSNEDVYRCKDCGKMCVKKDTHDRHVRQCTAAKRAKIDQETKEDASKIDGKEDDEELTAKPSAALSSLNSDLGISEEEMKRIMAIVDETSITCLKCYRMFGTISNLHRHAIRHLGWRRFKCKFCKFMCYNRSECRRHLRVVHETAVTKDSSIDSFIDKLESDAVLKGHKVALPRVEMKVQPGKSPSKEAAAEGNLATTSRRGAVSRKVPDKAETVLVTRSGMYRKPTFAELTGGRLEQNDSDSELSRADSTATSPEKEDIVDAKVLDKNSPDDDVDEEIKLEDEFDLRRDLPATGRNKRKGLTPCRAENSTENSALLNSPATAKPVSAFLNKTASPAKSPAKQHPKSPMANILSKPASVATVSKFSLQNVPSSGPAPGQLVQIPGTAGSTQAYTIMSRPITINSSGGSGGSMRQLLFKCTATTMTTTSAVSTMQSMGSGPVQVYTLSSSDTGAKMKPVATNAQGMPVLQPVLPVKPSTVGQYVKPPVLKPNTAVAGAKDTTEASTPMPVLAPVITTSAEQTMKPLVHHIQCSEASLKTDIRKTSSTQIGAFPNARSLTPQPQSIKITSIKPRSQTPGPSIHHQAMSIIDFKQLQNSLSKQRNTAPNPTLAMLKKSDLTQSASSSDSEIIETLGVLNSDTAMAVDDNQIVLPIHHNEPIEISESDIMIQNDSLTKDVFLDGNDEMLAEDTPTSSQFDEFTTAPNSQESSGATDDILLTDGNFHIEEKLEGMEVASESSPGQTGDFLEDMMNGGEEEDGVQTDPMQFINQQ